MWLWLWDAPNSYSTCYGINYHTCKTTSSVLCSTCNLSKQNPPQLIWDHHLRLNRFYTCGKAASKYIIAAHCSGLSTLYNYFMHAVKLVTYNHIAQIDAADGQKHTHKNESISFLLNYYNKCSLRYMLGSELINQCL